jgi:hypothetical protein
VQKRDDGSVVALALSDFDSDGDLDLAVMEGAASGLLGQDDYDEAGQACSRLRRCDPGVRERLGCAFRHCPAKGGAQLVANGRTPINAKAEFEAQKAQLLAG